MAGDSNAPTTQNAPGGSDQTPGGSSGDSGPKQTKSGDDEANGGHVSYDSYRKLLDEKKNMSQRLAKLEAEQKERDRKALEENENYKGLAEQYRAEAEEFKGKLESVNQQITRSRKVNAVLEQLDGRVESKYWHLIDDKKIVVDDDGNIDKMSVTKYAESFKKEFGEVIKTPQTSDVPPTPPKGANGSAVTIEEFQRMSIDPSVSKKDLLEARKRLSLS